MKLKQINKKLNDEIVKTVETFVESESHACGLIKSMVMKYALESCYVSFANKASNWIEKSIVE